MTGHEPRASAPTPLHLCASCRRGKHLSCSGIKCRCVLTPRCERNAQITADRDHGGDAA